jgi:ribonuclease P protein subunit RPR2
MDENLAAAQTIAYAEELRVLYARERAQREAVEDSLQRLERSYRTTVRALAATLELRDYQTGGHTERVTTLALRLAEQVAPELVSDPQLEYGFLLHDLGKIGIPDAILLKPSSLTSDEAAQMREHTRLGERILSGIPYLGGLAREIVASHHERWNGSGYPRGLSGVEIPVAARIFAVADAFDAMTNDRPYRPALPVTDALAEIRRVAGDQFDPDVAHAFVRLEPTTASAV